MKTMLILSRAAGISSPLFLFVKETTATQIALAILLIVVIFIGGVYAANRNK